jgi:hypothetical protein
VAGNGAMLNGLATRAARLLQRLGEFVSEWAQRSVFDATCAYPPSVRGHRTVTWLGVEIQTNGEVRTCRFRTRGSR